MIGIYIIENLINGKKYVGKSTNVERRLIHHKHSLSSRRRSNDVNRYLYASVQKYGWENFKAYLLFEVQPSDIDKLNDYELAVMQMYKTLDRDYGYNLRSDSSSQHYCHPETIELLRKTMIGVGNPNYGNKWTDEQKKRMSDIAKQRHKDGFYGDEWKAKVSVAVSKMWLDDDRKQRMIAKVRQNTRYRFYQYNKSGELLGVYETISELLATDPKLQMINVYNVCNGHKKSHRGYVFKKELKK